MTDRTIPRGRISGATPVPEPWFACSLRNYQRRWLRLDVLSALTLLAIAIPEQLATARLAGMPPISGYYTFAAGSLVFALLGSSPQLSVGADSTIAPLFAGAIAGFAATGSGHYVNLVEILAVLVGVILAAIWLLRLAWISEFLSAPIITGFLAGIAVLIVVHQLPALLDVPGGGGSTISRLQAIAGQLGQINYWSLGIGVGVFVIVIALEHLPGNWPAALIAMVVSTATVELLGIQEHNIGVLGHIVDVGPHFGLQGLSLHVLAQLAPSAGIVALVIVTQSAATTRAFARRSDYRVDVGRDLFAIGGGSVLAGLAGGFPVDASPPRTASVSVVGGRTQLAGLLAVVMLMALLPAIGLLHDVPLATLAGVLMFLATRIFRVGELRRIARFNLVEFGLAIVTLLTVVFAGVEVGIGVAIALAILDRTRLTALPQVHVLGRVPGTTSWAPLSTAEGAEQLPGVLVLLFATPLWYANSVHFRDQFDAALDRASDEEPVSLVVLDTLGMSDIDYTGMAALVDVLDHLDELGVSFAIARAGPEVQAELHRAGIVPRRIPGDHLFPVVHEAVVALRSRPPWQATST